MAFIKLSNASVEYPIFGKSGRSLTNRIVEIATGGQVNRDAKGNISVKALREITLEVSSGERLGIVGHNGAGKSSLLKLISGVYEPTQGQITKSGRIGSLTDVSLGINPDSTGRENIVLRGSLLGLSKKQIDEKIQEIIDFTEIGDFVDLPVRTYSSGMHLRLAFSVATAIDSEILVMDEWLSVGDESFRHKAENRLREMLDASEILVIASHSWELLQALCTRIIWLEHGTIKADGPPEKVLPSYFS